jgi:hypothetical protein
MNKESKTTEQQCNKQIVNTRFECKCGCNDFYFIGTIPEINTDEGTQEKDALYGCFDCGDNYYLSEINGC